MILGDDGGWPLPRDGRTDLPPDIAAILFTSGSTGQPKGVMLRAAALLNNAIRTTDRIPLRLGDRLAIAIPYHFTSAICHFLAAMLRGATLVCSSRRHLPAEFLEFLTGAAPDAFGGSPLQLRWLSAAGDGLPQSLRWAMSSGDRLPADVTRALRRNGSGPDVIIAYGLTEVAGRLCILDPALALEHPDSVGTPLPGLTITIRDSDGNACADGEIGEVHVAGDTLFSGYLDSPAISRASFRHEEFRTGDIARMEGGMLRLLGRNDDVFKVAGIKVSAAVISDALMATGILLDAAVMPAEREAIGAVPEAWVVPRDPSNPPDRRSLLRHLRSVLPPNHLPAAIHVVSEIPRVGSGKLDRSALQHLRQRTGE